jgi:hypothetical protein
LSATPVSPDPRASSIEELGIRLDDEGKMHVDPEARRLRVATRWRDLDGFHEFLAERLLA